MLDTLPNLLAGGTNSPISFPENYPKWVSKGQGAYVFDTSGRKYIDLWMGYGALLFGHADEQIIDVIKKTITNGWFFSNPPIVELELAETIHKLIPSAEKVRYATTGSDAVAYALRAARSHTKRDKILTIKGGYHGVHEGVIKSAGVNKITEANVDFIPYNDIYYVKEKLKSKEYAAFILEPILANSGCTPPRENYLNEVREICSETDTILIFDEVVTGTRIHVGGAQSYYNVTPDLTVFSKAIANALPLSVVCGKEFIMNEFMPVGNVFFAGTFNGHPLSLAVAKHVYSRLSDGKIHEKVNALGDRLRKHIRDEIDRLDLHASVQGVGSMLTVAFGCEEFEQGLSPNHDSKTYTTFIQKLASKGIVFPPLCTETVFLSPVHQDVIEEIELKISEALTELKECK